MDEIYGTWRTGAVERWEHGYSPRRWPDFEDDEPKQNRHSQIEHRLLRARPWLFVVFVDLLRTLENGLHDLLANQFLGVALGFVPSGPNFFEQALALCCDLDLMGPRIVEAHKLKPAIVAHALDVTADRRRVHVHPVGELIGGDATGFHHHDERVQLCNPQLVWAKCLVVDPTDCAVHHPQSECNALAGNTYCQITYFIRATCRHIGLHSIEGNALVNHIFA